MNSQFANNGEDGSMQLRQVFDRFHLNMVEPPNFLRLLSKSRSATSAYLEAEQALANGLLISRQREQIALAVAEINDSDYCLAAHSATAKSSGLSDEDIRLARRAAAPQAKDDAMLNFIQSVVLQRGEIKDDELRALLKAGFSEAEVVEIIANIALNIFTNYLNLVFRTQPDLALLATRTQAA